MYFIKHPSKPEEVLINLEQIVGIYAGQIDKHSTDQRSTIKVPVIYFSKSGLEDDYFVWQFDLKEERDEHFEDIWDRIQTIQKRQSNG